MVNIKGINKAALLAALYNGSFQQGMGVMHTRGRQQMSIEEAEELVAIENYFDYLHGRILKVDIGQDTLDTWAYNNDVGAMAAEMVVAELRALETPVAHPSTCHLTIPKSK